MSLKLARRINDLAGAYPSVRLPETNSSFEWLRREFRELVEANVTDCGCKVVEFDFDQYQSRKFYVQVSFTPSSPSFLRADGVEEIDLQFSLTIKRTIGLDPTREGFLDLRALCGRMREDAFTAQRAILSSRKKSQ